MSDLDKKQRIGQYIKCSMSSDTYDAYVPQILPPMPAIDMEELYPLLDQANTALGRLDGMSLVLPDPALFLYMYVRKEAILSSQIEGTQSSLSDLFLFENDQNPNVSIDDTAEVSNYVTAMDYGLERLKEFPLSLRLIREIHEKLMAGVRGGNKMPGEFRSSQNWIGGAKPSNALFVPPPPDKLAECLDHFEKFLHDENVKMPTLVKAALAHVQFETIHPFLDGNGRLGRLLITFILCMEGVIKEPLLYLSLYFKANRQAYYDHLQSVRETGDWESWIAFFLTGVSETAKQATETVQKIIQLFSKDQAAIENHGKSTAAMLTIHRYLRKHPISNTSNIKERTGLSLPTILRALVELEALDIVKEMSGKERNKVFAYSEYLGILSAGTEPLRY